MANIVLGGGCFWCLEAAYQMVDGVEEVVSGYAGGSDPQSSYEKVCTGATGHAEVVRLTYDPAIVSLEQLLAIFWIIHDPTSLNRQGADVGTQYRSIILYEEDGQKAVIDKSLADAQQKVDRPIVTEVVLLQKFYEAEPYHQNYFLQHPEQAYCQAIIEPKLTKLRSHFADKLKTTGQ